MKYSMEGALRLFKTVDVKLLELQQIFESTDEEKKRAIAGELKSIDLLDYINDYGIFGSVIVFEYLDSEEILENIKEFGNYNKNLVDAIYKLPTDFIKEHFSDFLECGASLYLLVEATDMKLDTLSHVQAVIDKVPGCPLKDISMVIKDHSFWGSCINAPESALNLFRFLKAKGYSSKDIKTYFMNKKYPIWDIHRIEHPEEWESI